MLKETYRGVVRDGKVVLIDVESPLPEGTEVLVTAALPRPGTAAAVLAALEGAPRVPGEWVDELERLIAAGAVPPTRTNPFADEGSAEGH